MNTINQDYYEVGYIQRGGKTGAMGAKHDTMQKAKDHITYLQNDSPGNMVHNADRQYFITHIIMTETKEIVYTDKKQPA